jgi:hypothetical protein
MSSNEPRDDEILGRALSRAIETAEINETRYDRSRIGVRPLKRDTSFWRVAALAASILVAGALGSTLLDRPTIDGPVAQQPSPSIAPTNSPATTVTPAPSPAPQTNAIDHQRVFTWRDGLPPTSQHLDSVGKEATAEERIKSRVNALNNAVSGVSGTILLADPKQFFVQSVKIQGDTATIDYSARFPPSGSSADVALVQEIVYTVTEEPGITRVLVTENGKPMNTGHILWEKPLARDDVSGYGVPKDEVIAEEQSRPCAPNCPSPTPAVLTNTYSVDTIALGAARFIVQVESGDWENFSVSGRGVDDSKDPSQSKYQILIQVKGTEKKSGLEIVDRSPLRSIRSVTKSGGTVYELALDDRRPWRVALLPNPDRIVVDIGGVDRSISDTVAVYSPGPIAPQPGAFPGSQALSIGRQFIVSGMSRTFEATTAWRVRDSANRVVASGFTTASRGTSALWGTFQAAVQLPATVSGNVTLEVFWASPRDGADMGLVEVPLTVR